ncbi:MAG: HAD-IIB family hydrolase [Gammaproteobacteria bacterium]|nr:HAD-IIB family hydrolase [Gammaproteobacteria bacterium]
MKPVQPIIFTDMDGSLLDHDSYSHADADELLAWLRNKQIPVIPVTSKTRAEVLKLREQLNNQHPFIVENGAAVFSPLSYFKHNDFETTKDGYYCVKSFVESRAHWQAVLRQVDVHLNEAFLSFEQCGIEGIMEMTGLTLDEARLASQREFGEPLKWQGTEAQLNSFSRYVCSEGGQLLRGGRFVHLSGICDKGLALRWLLGKYKQQKFDKDIVAIALGDSHNDTAMLEAVDYAIVIRSPAHDYPQLKQHPNQFVYKTEQEGPRGWVEGMMQVLAKLGINN